MESYDDLADGTVPELSLLLNHEQMDHIPKDLYELYKHRLKQMTSISLSHNKLSYVSGYMQQLTRLQELDLSHNTIRTLPKEIGQHCIMLRSLLLHDNALVSLPDLALHVLETLDLRNNNLQNISSKLSSIETLKNIPCDGNLELNTIPVDMRSDSALVLWTLRLQETHQSKIDGNMQRYEEIEAIAKITELEKMQLHLDLKRLQDSVDILKRERPVKWIKLKYRALKCTSQASKGLEGCIQWLRNVYSSWKEHKKSSRVQEMVHE